MLMSAIEGNQFFAERGENIVKLGKLEVSPLLPVVCQGMTKPCWETCRF